METKLAELINRLGLLIKTNLDLTHEQIQLVKDINVTIADLINKAEEKLMVSSFKFTKKEIIKATLLTITVVILQSDLALAAGNKDAWGEAHRVSNELYESFQRFVLPGMLLIIWGGYVLNWIKNGKPETLITVSLAIASLIIANLKRFLSIFGVSF
ncbi:MAG: hypothetical protein J0H68_09675 [Sphingobacteriia bacterium]|nr:hypothetical protein [Sphingobacteriia bacterium]